MARSRGFRAVTSVDPKALAEFRAGIRKRYTDEEILGQLRACAADPRKIADDARVRRARRVDRAPADGDRSFRQLEPREAAGRARAEALRDAGRAAPVPSRARRPRRPSANLEGHRRASRASCRRSPSTGTCWLTDERAARGGIRRAGGGGEAGAGDRARRRAGTRARPPAKSPTARRPGDRTPRCSPSGRCTGCSKRGAVPGRRSSISSARGFSRTASKWRPTERCTRDSQPREPPVPIPQSS